MSTNSQYWQNAWNIKIHPQWLGVIAGIGTKKLTRREPASSISVHLNLAPVFLTRKKCEHTRVKFRQAGHASWANPCPNPLHWEGSNSPVSWLLIINTILLEKRICYMYFKNNTFCTCIIKNRTNLPVYACTVVYSFNSIYTLNTKNKQISILF